MSIETDVDEKLTRLLHEPRTPLEERGRILTPTSRVGVWWSESNNENQRIIKKVIVKRLEELAATPCVLGIESNGRTFLQLCQMAAELKLDKSVRSSFEMVLDELSRGQRQLEIPKDRVARFFGWAGLVQPQDGSWFNRWEILWQGEEAGFWSVAISAMMNVRPGEVALRIPEILDRENRMGQDAVAYLFHEILQEQVDWYQVIGAWQEKGRVDDVTGVKSIVRQMKIILDKEYHGQIVEPAAIGLNNLEELTT